MENTPISTFFIIPSMEKTRSAFTIIFLQEVLLFPAMKPDDPNKHNAEDENPAEAPVQNGA